MVIDTSAIMAILQQEAEAAEFAQRIEAAAVRLVSAATVLEAGLLAQSRRHEAGVSELDNFILRGGFEVVPFDAEQAIIAREAYRRFGKGRHPAGLNFGDCFSYALSRVSGEPLLFKGNDFARTDVASAATA
jgi:ribonuclease VapC